MNNFIAQKIFSSVINEYTVKSAITSTRIFLWYVRIYLVQVSYSLLSDKPYFSNQELIALEHEVLFLR